MALALISAQTAVHDVTIVAASYKTIFTSTRVRSTMPQLDVTTYATEAAGDFIGGIERLTLDLAGILKKGTAVAGPLIPLPQNKAFVVQWDTSCSVTGTLNFSEAEVNRPAGQFGTITGTAFSIGTWVVAWVLS